MLISKSPRSLYLPTREIFWLLFSGQLLFRAFWGAAVVLPQRSFSVSFTVIWGCYVNQEKLERVSSSFSKKTWHTGPRCNGRSILYFQSQCGVSSGKSSQGCRGNAVSCEWLLGLGLYLCSNHFHTDHQGWLQVKTAMKPSRKTRKWGGVVSKNVEKKILVGER